GPQYGFGEITFDDAMIDQGVLRGFVPFKTGEPFDLRKLLVLEDALSSTPYFRRVEVIPQEEQTVNRQVPIHVVLIPARRERWSLGLGYGPETGARGTIGVDFRRLNRWGHRAETETNLSQVESRFAASYIVPKALARTDFTTYSVGWDDLHSK